MKYTRPIDAIEAGLRFQLVECDGVKATIELISNDAIRPIEVVAFDEVEPDEECPVDLMEEVDALRVLDELATKHEAGGAK